jgi:hypothetical protein
VPVSKIPEKVEVFLEKKRHLESEIRHLPVLAHPWKEGILIQRSLVPLHKRHLTTEN